MTRIALTIALCASLSACNVGGVSTLPAPSTVADSTKLDENIGRTATNAYTAASTLGRQLALAGHIDKARFKALDQKGYDLVLAIRSAYEAGNASDYLTLTAKLNATIAQIKGL